MDVKKLSIEGLKLIKPRVFADSRGFFLESYQNDRYNDQGIFENFAQDNHSFSRKNVIRGMHFQPGQAKLVRVASGKIYDVAVDLRAGSPSYGKWCGVYLDGSEHEQLYIPDGFAHGFCVISSEAHVIYKVSTVYDPDLEQGFRYDDPSVGIEWPVECPIISERDAQAPLLQEVT